MDHAHNDYVELLGETGMIGGLLALAAVVMMLRRGFAGVLRRESGASEWTMEKWVAVGATIACCGLLSHSFTDFNLHIPANDTWFVFALAIATAPGNSGKTN